MNYEKVYTQLINKSKNRQLGGYVESHHIVPRCMGGKDESSNLVKLTAKEHFLAHKLLCEIYPSNIKLFYALWLMAIGKKKIKCREPYKVSSRDYERMRLEFIKRSKLKKLSQTTKKLIAKKNSKPVIQYDFKGNIINKFSSASNAERFISNRPKAHWKKISSNVMDCCRLKQKSAYGFIWKYEGELLDLEQHKGSNNCVKGKKIIYQNKKYKTQKHFFKKTGMSNHMFYKMLNENKIVYEN